MVALHSAAEVCTVVLLPGTTSGICGGDSSLLYLSGKESLFKALQAGE